MSSNTPIYNIAKELNVDSNRIILACKTLGINAKGATKRLNKQELDKVKNYFEAGKNASQETVDINKNEVITKPKTRNIQKNRKIKYFSNRLIAKS